MPTTRPQDFEGHKMAALDLSRAVTINGQADEHCVDCQHWHKLPTKAEDVSQIFGECREQLRVALVPGQQGPFFFAGYPMLQPEFPACSKFKGRE